MSRVGAPPDWAGPRLLGGDPDSPLGELCKLFAKELQARPPPSGLQMEAGIEVFTYDHECALLREAWPSSGVPSTTARPCVFGRRCTAMHTSLAGHEESGGVVLVEAMTPVEMAAFESRGTHPSERRPCVLCQRAFMTSTYLDLRASWKQEAPPPFAINWYVNPVGAVGAYDPELCLPFKDDGDAWLGVYGRVAALVLDKLRLRQDAATRRWYVDQRGMLDFERGAACWASQSAAADFTLRQFFSRRPDVWDGTEVLAPFDPDVTRDAVRQRIARLSQLSAAYGASSGPRITWALAAKINDAHAVEAALRRGDAPNTARKATAPCETNLPEMDVLMLRAAAPLTNKCVAVRSKRPRKVCADAPQLLTTLCTRILEDGVNMRLISEAGSKVLATPLASDAVVRIAACSLLGSYLGCGSRPTIGVRGRLSAMGVEEWVSLLRGLPADVPLLWCVLTEYVALVTLPRAPHLQAMLKWESWRARSERVAVTLDAVRAGLDGHWSAEQSLQQVLSAGPLSDTMRRLHRREPRNSRRKNLDCVADPFQALQRATGGRVAPAALVRRYIAEFEAGLVEVAVNAAADALAGLPLQPDDGDHLAAALKAVLALRTLRRIDVSQKYCAAVMAASGARAAALDACFRDRVARSVFMCSRCLSVKNFVVRSGDTARTARTCGYLKLTAPNPVDDVPSISCDTSPDCAAAHVRELEVVRVLADGSLVGGMVLAGSEALTLAPCCGALCSTSALRVTPQGCWECTSCAGSVAGSAPAARKEAL